MAGSWGRRGLRRSRRSSSSPSEELERLPSETGGSSEGAEEPSGRAEAAVAPCGAFRLLQFSLRRQRLRGSLRGSGCCFGGGLCSGFLSAFAAAMSEDG
ncbi:MAG: hypothetical protein ACLR0N_15300 [Bilophila wadsworthia]